ncbi:MAG: type II secretion system inner membrane protein GspF [Deltaproteobacteria bacterium]|nr:type II secretion system inner membrane protein GspF [Deltaproteobacteria bacterium]MBW2421695.1 type II secretion system inner membrane protein GspF [Deltaproteobacteria bacterium]
MPLYAYKGMTTAGKSTKGTLSAENLAAARARMRQDGIFLTDINETQQAARRSTGPREEGRGFSIDLSFLRRIPAMERAVATRQLSTLVGAGIPLVESLNALVQQIEHAHLEAVMGDVRDRVNEGASLADAMQNTGQFDTLFVSMIRAGEAGGALDVVLERIADYLESQVSLSNKVSSILIYPAVMLLFAGLVVAALVTVVLPQITGLLLSLDQELPFYTRWIIAGSDFARNWWWAMLLGLVAFGFAFRSVIATERGRAVYDTVALKLPIVGRIVRVLAIARFSRTLSTLLSSGVGIVQALEISRHVANNKVIGEAITNARTSIVEGASIAAPLRASGEFPPLVTTMIEVGERSGEVDQMLIKVANTYDEQVENTISRLTALLEPMLILLMVGIVLVIIMATLMPLMQITNSLS